MTMLQQTIQVSTYFTSLAFPPLSPHFVSSWMLAVIHVTTMKGQAFKFV